MRPHRFRGFDYLGFHHYSLTMCTFRRQRFFAHAESIALVRDIFCNEATAQGFVIPAYCFMPDHVHLVASGRTEQCDLVRFGRSIRQHSGYRLRHVTAGPLWQDGYYEHILAIMSLSPARFATSHRIPFAGLVEDWEQYPFTGSQSGPLIEVLEWLDEHGAPDKDALLGLM